MCALSAATVNLAQTDKHSPLSCSIPSLSPSANGGVDLLAPPAAVEPLLSPGEPAHEFLNGAQDLIARLTACLRSLGHERERLKLAIEAAAETASISSRNGAANTGTQSVCQLGSAPDGRVDLLTVAGAAPNMVASLRSALQVAVQQNHELRSRLQRIRTEADVAMDGPSLFAALELDLNASQRLGHHSLSYSSSCVSQSEFFDAKEYLTDVAASDSSSSASETEMENEAEEEGSVSEASEIGNEANHDLGELAVFLPRRHLVDWVDLVLLSVPSLFAQPVTRESPPDSIIITVSGWEMRTKSVG